MAKSTSHPWVLVAAVAIMALALSAVGPVLAQSGTGGTSSQGGTSIALQSGDTLGTLVSRYNLSGSDLRNFFTQNTGLTLQPGQTITFPAGVTVNMGGAAGQVTETATAAAGGLATATSPAGGVVTETATAAVGGLATATSPAGGAVTETATAAVGGLATETPAAGGMLTVTPTTAAAGAATSVATAAVGAATDVATAAAGVGAAQMTSTPVATIAVETPTALATMAATSTTAAMPTTAATATTVATMAATSTTAATATTMAPLATNTPAAGGGSTGTSQTYTTVQGDTLGKILGWMGFPVSGAAGGATSGSAPTDAQLQEFVTMNTNLQFVSGQTAMLPAGIPQTGQGNVTGTPAAGVTGTPGANQGTYTVQAGDTLQDIANRYGITLQQLLQMNPNLLQPGMTINVPGGTGTTGTIPQTGNQAERTFSVQNGETLNSVISRFGLGTNDMSGFFSANCDVQVQSGQTVRFPIAINQSGNAQGDNFTYQTKDGDTLCSVVNMMGLNLSQGSTGGTAGGATANATATPLAGAAVETATPAATVVETATPLATALETATPAATVVGTATPVATAAAGGVGTATPVATAAANGSSGGTTGGQGGTGMGGYANNQDGLLREFVKYNPNLRLQNGGTVRVPAGIPQTGGASQGTGGTGTGTGAQGQAGRFVNRQGCPSAQAGSGVYISRGGESFQSIANKFGVSLQEVLDRNPGVLSVSRGQVVMLPGVEGPGLWNLQLCNQGGPTAQPSR